MKSINQSNNYSNINKLAKNSIFNLLGYGIPLIIAIFTIPILIEKLGTEKFGILSIIWLVIGYFSFFDFGISRALTKFISEKIGKNEEDEIPNVFIAAFLLMLVISIIIAFVLNLLAPTLILKYFKISDGLKYESLESFYYLIFSIPIVTTTAGLRGLLESYQKFLLINYIRVFLGTATFIIPLICLFYSKSLITIVLALVIIRIIVWLMYAWSCLKIRNDLFSNIKIKFSLIIRILKFGGWITISNIIVPIFVYSDRFLIGTLISAEAITYYVTPYEVISKLLLIPGAIAGVMFPTIAANVFTNSEVNKNIYRKVLKYVFIIIFPLILISISFSYEGLNLWLNTKFAEKSSPILVFLSYGILFNSLAYIPYTFLEGNGRPDLPAKIQLLELPFFLFFLWLFAVKYGINGVALIWMLRTFIDSILLYFINSKVSNIKLHLDKRIYIAIVLLFFPTLIYKIDIFLIKFIIISFLFLFFIYYSWKYLLENEDKITIKKIFRMIAT